MENDLWRTILISALALTGALGFGYRVYRLSQGGPIADVYGQALLGVLLGSIALLFGVGVDWVRWVAFAFGLLFGLIVMPIWTLAVLIPLRPRWPDYAFTGLYWTCLGAIVIASLAA